MAEVSLTVATKNNLAGKKYKISKLCQSVEQVRSSKMNLTGSGTLLLNTVSQLEPLFLKKS
jgi:hypothetical protein